MEWEDKALEKIKRVPIFVRGFAKNKVEEYVASKGEVKVTEEDVNQTKKIMFLKIGTDTKKLVDLMRKQIHLNPNGQISDNTHKLKLGQNTESNNNSNKLYEVTGCNDNHLCPFSLIDARNLVLKLNNKLEEMNITNVLLDRVDGPVVYHHTFRVAVAECPNACSQPQIKDFGIVAEALPKVSGNECINCNLCIEECKEDAIAIKDPCPIIDYKKCVRCEACVKVCPVNALVTEKKGYSVFIGGKLGRHPQFAFKLLDLVDEDTVVKALESCLKLYINESKENERFGSYVARTYSDLA